MTTEGHAPDPGPVSGHPARMAALGVLIDRIVEADRELAVIAACRAELVQQARRLSVADVELTSAEAGRALDDAVIGWTPITVAHRELISELACALTIPERTASALVEHSRVLTSELPDTMAALSTGEISYRHAQVLADHAASLPGAAVAGFERAVLPDARELTVAKFDRKARIVRERTHPESITARVTAARDNRSIGWEPARDGMVWLTAYLPAETAAASYNRIDDIARALQHAEEPRTLTQLRADVFSDLLIDGTTGPYPDTTAHRDGSPSTSTTAGAGDGDSGASIAAGNGREEAPLTVQDLLDNELDVLMAMKLGIAEHTGTDIPLHTLARDILDDPRTAPPRQGPPQHTPLDPPVPPRQAPPQHTPPDPSDPPGHAVRTHASADGIGHGIRATVLVTVPVLTLLDPDNIDAEPGSLEGYGPIDPDTARRLAGHAPSFTRLLTHPEAGTVLSVGRDRYSVPADLRLWLRIRDETCRYPGCNTTARRSDIDHTHDWALDGRTGHDNLAHLCPKHHNLKHHTAWTIRQRDAGTIEHTSPTGKLYRTHPATTMSAS